MGIGAVARMQEFCRQLGKIGGMDQDGDQTKKWGLVMAKFADQKPRPQICVVSKVTFGQDR
jgi:hypothetical protein